MARTNFKASLASLLAGSDVDDASPNMMIRLGKAISAAHPGFGIHSRRYPTTTKGALLTLTRKAYRPDPSAAYGDGGWAEGGSLLGAEAAAALAG